MKLPVFTATIAVLVALLLPAVHSAPESARQASSVGEQHQMGLALLKFKYQRGASPAGGDRSNAADSLFWEPRKISVMPFLEMAALHAKFNREASIVAPPNSPNSTNGRLTSQSLEAYLCSSNMGSVDEEQPPGRMSYEGVCGSREVFNTACFWSRLDSGFQHLIGVWAKTPSAMQELGMKLSPSTRGMLTALNFGFGAHQERVEIREINDGSALTFLIGASITRQRFPKSLAGD